MLYLASFERNISTPIEGSNNIPISETGRIYPERKQYLMHGYAQLLKEPQLMVYQHNNLTAAEQCALKLLALRKGFKIRACRGGIMKALLRTSPLEVMTPLFKGSTFVFYCHEQKGQMPSVADAKTLYDALSKQHKLIFLGAKIDNLLFTKESFLKLSEIGTLPQIQSQLLGTLQSGTLRVTNLLNTSGQILAQILKQHSETSKE